MKALQKYIKSSLQKIVEKLPYLQIKYEYDDLSNTHLIEVLPLYAYEHDKSYIQLETEMLRELSEKYPYEDVAFVSENSLCRISKPMFILGSAYEVVDEGNTCNVVSNVSTKQIEVDFSKLSLQTNLCNVNLRDNSLILTQISESRFSSVILQAA
ncbi:MAG: hypothetical protein RMJ97_08345 [Raineya sp.]|nr:hypothetical protein [Raineya sp.]MDW8296879.1 hypothetical protein [Raineya sp.]